MKIVKLLHQRELHLEMKPLTHAPLDSLLLVLPLFTVKMMGHIPMMLPFANVRYRNRSIVILYQNFPVAVDCGAPDPADPNGSVEVSSTTFGGRALYSCNPGFTIVGNAVSFCLATGQWSSEAPECRRKPINGN